MRYHYVPPAFGLYELDAEPQRLDRPGRRACWHFNGLIGVPAEEVILAWTSPDAAVLVSSQSDEASMVRMSAAHLALGGTFLPPSSRPDDTANVQHEIQRISESPELWQPGPPLAAGGAPADLAVLDGYSLACAAVGRETVIIVAVGLDDDQLRVRPVRDWTAYDLDASRPHPVADLQALL